MPSLVLGSRASNPFDFIGTVDGYAVTHIGLLSQDIRVTQNSEAEVFQMGPPLRVEPGSSMPAHVVGWLELSRDEIDGLHEWLEDIKTLSSKCYYIALPSVLEKRDGISGRVIGWKFSCAGFVKQAYKEGANILLVPDDEYLPPIDLSKIKEVWPSNANLLSRYGLKGEGPWNILLPGYLLHSSDQTRQNLPFFPAPNHLYYPCK